MVTVEVKQNSKVVWNSKALQIISTLSC